MFYSDKMRKYHFHIASFAHTHDIMVLRIGELPALVRHMGRRHFLVLERHTLSVLLFALLSMVKYYAFTVSNFKCRNLRNDKMLASLLIAVHTYYNNMPHHAITTTANHGCVSLCFSSETFPLLFSFSNQYFSMLMLVCFRDF